MLQIVLAILTAIAIPLLATQWLIKTLTDTTQLLVNQMKQYELDGRAGLLVCKGPGLRILYADPSLTTIVGNRTSVSELLPPALRERHRMHVARCTERLPDSLNHPLRKVQLVGTDQRLIEVNCSTQTLPNTTIAGCRHI
jgi:hypothetical protein